MDAKEKENVEDGVFERVFEKNTGALLMLVALVLFGLVFFPMSGIEIKLPEEEALKKVGFALLNVVAIGAATLLIVQSGVIRYPKQPINPDEAAPGANTGKAASEQTTDRGTRQEPIAASPNAPDAGTQPAHGPKGRDDGSSPAPRESVKVT